MMVVPKIASVNILIRRN